ncbi:HK97 family phage prohead protease [Bifidobacterium sp. ESL0775]|uniref:HK97 family phage prohead protease n=1 Tax=Bifidobacterium sp. ESL0775 TaxID=2983230 RepID=UPI0023F69FCC|nr:HK97 family phage prohead protease [Bifidobacterium sp. ESL0775]WEV69938.1 HK97 family phage prohead protease [Bifidobacterium sp. ESL0775]
MQQKSIPINAVMPGEKADDMNMGEGQFTAYASTWTREPDCYGDVVAKGAFTRTLNEWKTSGDSIPILYGHNSADPDYNIGYVKQAVQDEHGLKILGQLDIDNNPKAAQVYKLLKGRRLRQMSFAFTINSKANIPLTNGTSVRELRDVTLYEVSIVPLGANQDTSIEAVKSAIDSTAKAQKNLNEYALWQYNYERKNNNDMNLLQKLESIEKKIGEYKSRLDAGENILPDEEKDLEQKTKEAKELRRRIDLFKSVNADLAANGVPEVKNGRPTQGEAVGTKKRGHLSLRSISSEAPRTVIGYSGKLLEKGLAPQGQALFPVPIVNTEPIAAYAGGEVPPRLLDYLQAVTRDAPTYSVIQEVEKEDSGKASVVAPGEEKPVKKIGLERLDQRLKVVAVLSEPIDKFLLEDAGNIYNWLGTRYVIEVFNAIEDEIINGDGTGEHFTGLEHAKGTKSLPYAGTILDTIMAGTNALETIGLVPDIIALSPADWLTIQKLRDDNGAYYMGNVVDPVQRTLWGRQIATVPGLPEGTGWVIGAGALTLSTDGVNRIEWDTSGGFTRNQIQARVEGRYNLDILKPHALIKLDLKAKA